MSGEAGVDDAAQQEQSWPLDLVRGVEGLLRIVGGGPLDLHGEPGLFGPVGIQVEGMHVVRLGTRGTRDVLVVDEVLGVRGLIHHRGRGDPHVRGQISTAELAGQRRCPVVPAPQDCAGHRVESVRVVVLGVDQHLAVVEERLAVDRAVDRGLEQLTEGPAGDQARSQVGLVRIPAGPVVVGTAGRPVGRRGDVRRLGRGRTADEPCRRQDRQDHAAQDPDSSGSPTPHHYPNSDRSGTPCPT